MRVRIGGVPLDWVIYNGPSVGGHLALSSKQTMHSTESIAWYIVLSHLFVVTINPVFVGTVDESRYRRYTNICTTLRYTSIEIYLILHVLLVVAQVWVVSVVDDDRELPVSGFRSCATKGTHA